MAPSEYPSIHDVCRLSQKELGGMSPPLFLWFQDPSRWSELPQPRPSVTITGCSVAWNSTTCTPPLELIFMNDRGVSGLRSRMSGS